MEDEEKREIIAERFLQPVPEELDVTLRVEHKLVDWGDARLHARSIIYMDFRDTDGQSLFTTPLCHYDTSDFESNTFALPYVEADSRALVVFDDGPPYDGYGKISIYGRFNEELHAELAPDTVELSFDIEMAALGDGAPDVDQISLECTMSRKEFHELARHIRESVPDENKTVSQKRHEEYLAGTRFPVYDGGFCKKDVNED